MLQVVDVHVAASEGLVVEHRGQQVTVGLEAVELERAQGEAQLGDGRATILSACHELRHQRVVGGADGAARLDGAIGAQARTLGQDTWLTVPGVGR